MKDVHDNLELLNTLLADSENKSSLWSPSNYWRPYCKRICNELNINGFKNFRTNQKILKGFGNGGVRHPSKPQAQWKRFIWNSASNLPVVKLIINKQQHIINVYHRESVQKNIQIAKLALSEIEKQFPDFNAPAGTTNGGAEDGFMWNGVEVSADWVMYLSRIADFYSKVPPESVRSIAEIGPGIGLTSLAHMALNPNLKTIINIDIVPIIYISGQFLKSENNILSIDYLDTKNKEKILIDGNDELTIYSLPPWELNKVEGKIDYFFNAYSFMEMEKDICISYSKIINNLTQKGILLHSHVNGHKPNAGNQKEQIDLNFLKNVFQTQYTKSLKPIGLWSKYYDGPQTEIILMQKEAA